MLVGVLGADGLLGTELVNYFEMLGNDVVCITRDTYTISKKYRYDLFYKI